MVKDIPVKDLMIKANLKQLEDTVGRVKLHQKKLDFYTARETKLRFEMEKLLAIPDRL